MQVQAQENLPYKKRKENRQSQEEPASLTASLSDLSMSDCTESSTNIHEQGSPSPPPPPLAAIAPRPLIKQEKEEPDDMIDDTVKLGPAGKADRADHISSSSERQHSDLMLMLAHQVQAQAALMHRDITRCGGNTAVIRPIPMLFPPQLWPLYGAPLLPSFSAPRPPPLARPLSPPSPRPVSPPHTRPAQPGVTRRQTRRVEPYISEPGRRQKDEQKARELGLTPEDVNKIVDMSMEEFNEFIQKRKFNEDQLSTLRDMRRRGKNKVAAQNCRKRKLENIDQLQEKVVERRETLEENERKNEYLKTLKTEELKTLKNLINQLNESGKEVLCQVHPIVTDSCLTKNGCTLTVKRT